MTNSLQLTFWMHAHKICCAGISTLCTLCIALVSSQRVQGARALERTTRLIYACFTKSLSAQCTWKDNPHPIHICFSSHVPVLKNHLPQKMALIQKTFQMLNLFENDRLVNGTNTVSLPRVNFSVHQFCANFQCINFVPILNWIQDLKFLVAPKGRGLAAMSKLAPDKNVKCYLVHTAVNNGTRAPKP